MKQTAVGTKEVLTLADLVSARPLTSTSYRRDDLLTGIDSERKRLGARGFLVSLHQQEFDIDGLTEYVFLLESFDSELEAKEFAKQRGLALLQQQTSQRPWGLEQEGQMHFLPKPIEPTELRALCSWTHKVRGGTYDTKYACVRAIGPFNKEIVGADLFRFLNADRELWSYFVDVGEAIRTDTKPPQPA